jgi:hypothetical protein
MLIYILNTEGKNHMGQSAFSQSAIQALAAAVKSSALLLNGSGSGCTIHLYVNNVQPAPGMSLSNFTDSANPSYSAQVVTNADTEVATNSSGQNIVAIGGGVSWYFTAPSSPPETVYGYYIQTAGSFPSLVYAKSLNTPIVVGYADQVVSLSPEVSFSNNIGGV